MIFEKYHVKDIEKEYFSLHDDVFGKDPFHYPNIVYIAKINAQYIGFISGYWHDKKTFYIQKTAISKKLKGQGLSAEFAINAWQFLKEKEKIRYLLGQIETDNISPIITALKTGWKINGYFTDTIGKQYIRTILDLGN